MRKSTEDIFKMFLNIRYYFLTLKGQNISSIIQFKMIHVCSKVGFTACSPEVQKRAEERAMCCENQQLFPHQYENATTESFNCHSFIHHLLWLVSRLEIER